MKTYSLFLGLSSLLFATSSPADLVINEFLAINDSDLQDASGAFADWIEIHNNGDAAVNLEGHLLTDDPEFDLTEPNTHWKFPSQELAAGDYLVVFASGRDTHSDGELHTNFSVSASEYLALVTPDGATKLSEFGPDYPKQRTDISYGLKAATTDTYQFFPGPTPGSANSGGIEGFVADTKFSVTRGFHTEPFELEITSATEGAAIYYTTDGRTPSKGSIFSGPIGSVYEGPFTVDTTAVIRAVALKTGFENTNVDTHSYVFIQDVIKQSAEQEGWPTEWLGNGGSGSFPADYEMDPEVTEDPAYKDLMDDALLALPTLSLVTDPDHLFNNSKGIYQRPQQSGAEWERPVSVELIHPDGSKGFHINAGVRIQGGHTREPAKNPKHSFRLVFKKEYGASKLNYKFFDEDTATTEFDTITLRGAGNQSWLHHNEFEGDNRGRAQYVRDQWAKDTQRAMGHPAVHNRMMHLYLNGLYWGLYNPTERPTGGFGEAYLGGSKDDYDALNSGEPKDGDKVAYNDLFARAKKDLTVQANYDAVAEVLDIDAFTDYMILNQYGGNIDWDHHNWYGMRNRNGGKWYFFAWDSEFFFTRIDDNVITKRNANNPSEIFQQLVENEDYLRYFGDRVHKHLFNDGLLTEASVLERWEKRSADVELALIGESARWGDYRRDVHRRAGPFLLYTRDGAWMDERNRLLKDYFPERNEQVMDQYRREGLYPKTASAPTFDQHGGAVSQGQEITVSIPGGIFVGRGDIHVVTDGTDPRMADGSPNPNATKLAAGKSFTIGTSGTVKARHLFDGHWSALTATYFVIGSPADASNLEITEVHFKPASPTVSEDPDGLLGSKDFEFIELHNTSAERIDLSGLAFSNGITFSLAAHQPNFLEPDAYGLIVANRSAFLSRYPTIDPALILGEFADDTNLKNGGETLTLRDNTGKILWTTRYDNQPPWPVLEEGYSLVLQGDDPATGEAWRASTDIGGSPGSADSGDNNAGTSVTYATWKAAQFEADAQADATLSGILADPDADGWSNFAEYAQGLDPLKRQPLSAATVTAQDAITLRYRRAPNLSDVIFTVEVSDDLLSWTNADAMTVVSQTPTDSGKADWVSAQLEESEGAMKFVRVRMSMKN